MIRRFSRAMIGPTQDSPCRLKKPRSCSHLSPFAFAWVSLAMMLAHGASQLGSPRFVGPVAPSVRAASEHDPAEGGFSQPRETGEWRPLFSPKKTGGFRRDSTEQIFGSEMNLLELDFGVHPIPFYRPFGTRMEMEWYGSRLKLSKGSPTTLCLWNCKM